jgi:hypothetical protein
MLLKLETDDCRINDLSQLTTQAATDAVRNGWSGELERPPVYFRLCRELLLVDLICKFLCASWGEVRTDKDYKPE